MVTAGEFADRVGRVAIAEAIGVGLTAVSNNVVKGSFPSSWYLALKELAEAQGIECPPALFRMKTGTISQNVVSAADYKAGSDQSGEAVA
jgi:hypothetical protein